MRGRNSGSVILSLQSTSSILVRRELSSGDIGSTVGRKPLGSRKYARKVGSCMDADFHGLRPVARFKRIIPNDQMSLNMGEYVPVGANKPP